MPDSPIAPIAHAIQLAVAPVFLLTGIGALLGVMTSRLGRIVDRARVVERTTPQDPAVEQCNHQELLRLARRARLISTSISLCTITALLVSAVIAVLFVGAVLNADTSIVVALLFVAAMLTLILALVHFLREILLAIAGLRIGPK